MNYFLELVGGQCMNDYRGLLIKKQRKELDISLEALSLGFVLLHTFLKLKIISWLQMMIYTICCLKN